MVMISVHAFSIPILLPTLATIPGSTGPLPDAAAHVVVYQHLQLLFLFAGKHSLSIRWPFLAFHVQA